MSELQDTSKNEKIQKKVADHISSIKNGKKRNTLYQYRNINTNTLHQLLHKYVWASSPDKFNDIFDCCAFERFVKSTFVKLDEKLAERNKDAAKKPPKESIKIASFSATFKNPTMWAHYANNNTGICLVYDVSSFYDIHKVIYLKDVFEFQTFHSILKSSCDEKFFSKFFMQTMSCLKFSTWRYENEWRYVSVNSMNKVPINVKEIILGINTTSYDTDVIKKIAEILKIKVSKMEIDYENFQLVKVCIK